MEAPPTSQLMDDYQVRIFDQPTKMEYNSTIAVPRGDNIMDYISINTKTAQLRSITRLSSCPGCRDDIANQLGHMELGGCLYRPN